MKDQNNEAAHLRREWIRPETRRLEAGSAEASANSGDDNDIFS